MKLPVIKSVSEFVEEHDEDYVLEAVDVLEHVSLAKGLKDEELDVIGELISNFLGGVEVAKMVKDGKPKQEALNQFMGRVLGSIDKN
tara:strand:- start:110574 stop:110834 length:261 start_codon:yes stop_codon:yes gene_type:complete